MEVTAAEVAATAGDDHAAGSSELTTAGDDHAAGSSELATARDGDTAASTGVAAAALSESGIADESTHHQHRCYGRQSAQ